MLVADPGKHYHVLDPGQIDKQLLLRLFKPSPQNTKHFNYSAYEQNNNRKALIQLVLDYEENN